MHVPPPVIAVLCIIVMFFAGWLLPGLKFSFAGQGLIGGVLLLVGLALIFLAGMGFSKARTTVLPNMIHKSSSLVTGGIYRFTRNPMYLGMALAIVGAGIGAGNYLTPYALAAFVILITYLQIVEEEAGLAKIFGQEYTDYCTKVRRWI